MTQKRGTTPPTPFTDLPVDPAITEALAAQGITTAFPIQQQTITDAVAGRDICGKAKTGSGKTLAFGLPTIQAVAELDNAQAAGLILVPTRELALQVTAELARPAQALNVTTLAIYGGAPIERQIKRLRAGIDIIVATPGRLIDLVERNEANLSDVEIVVVDEADRMADLGFLPQVEWVLRHTTNRRQTLLFSATLDAATQTLVDRYQHNPAHHEVHSPTTTVDAMEHHFFKVHQMDRARVAAAIASGAQRSIVFVATKRGCDRLTSKLNDLGVAAAAIHGDLRQNDREKALAGFAAGNIAVLVATDVAARGIHVDNVDVVIHWDPTDNHKDYLHRSGRTARAGKSGVVVTLFEWNEELAVRRLMRRLGLTQTIDEMFSNDPRLKTLASAA